MRIAASICFLCLWTALVVGQERPADPNGVWYGDYGTSSESRTEVQIVLKWDGKVLSGTVATEDERLDIENARYDPDGGAVHLEIAFRGRGAPGRANTYHYIADGKLDKDTITGTWHNEFDKGDFQLKKIR